MRSVFASELSKRVVQDSRIQLITCDLGYGVLDDFAEKFPNNYFNLGITEQASMSIAAGMAQKGLRPFLYSIANFPTFRCLEQIRNDVHSMNLPVTIVSVGAGLGYGKAGYSHFAIEDISAMRSFGSIEIHNPSNELELKRSLDIILKSDGPSYLRIGGRLESSIGLSFQNFSDANSELALVFSGDLEKIVYSAASELHSLGVSVRVVSIPMLKDSEVDNFLINNKSKIVAIEEHVLTGGFSSMLLERSNDLQLNVSISRIGISNLDPHLVGDQNFLRSHYGITTQQIVARGLSLSGKSA